MIHALSNQTQGRRFQHKKPTLPNSYPLKSLAELSKKTLKTTSFNIVLSLKKNHGLSTQTQGLPFQHENPNIDSFAEHQTPRDSRVQRSKFKTFPTASKTRTCDVKSCLWTMYCGFRLSRSTASQAEDNIASRIQDLPCWPCRKSCTFGFQPQGSLFQSETSGTS